MYSDMKPSAEQLVDFTAEWTDFTDSAAMIDNLDVIVSIDSAVIHLAAALNKPRGHPPTESRLALALGAL
ncbi:MAG: glycosyltransferase family 9 protein [Brachymonas sp.]|nr:glycosyltransferase family 9 protein [Brachymonas sp.]